MRSTSSSACLTTRRSTSWSFRSREGWHGLRCAQRENTWRRRPKPAVSRPCRAAALRATAGPSSDARIARRGAGLRGTSRRWTGHARERTEKACRRLGSHLEAPHRHDPAGREYISPQRRLDVVGDQSNGRARRQTRRSRKEKTRATAGRNGQSSKEARRKASATRREKGGARKKERRQEDLQQERRRQEDCEKSPQQKARS
jgi:hypothetical protein